MVDGIESELRGIRIVLYECCSNHWDQDQKGWITEAIRSKAKYTYRKRIKIN